MFEDEFSWNAVSLIIAQIYSPKSRTKRRWHVEWTRGVDCSGANQVVQGFGVDYMSKMRDRQTISTVNKLLEDRHIYVNKFLADRDFLKDIADML